MDPRCYLLLLVIASGAVLGNGYNLKSATFLSPGFVLGPGSVENRFYTSIDFPTGHIGIKSFDAEVVDEAGNSIPLHETYLHHWVLARYQASKSNNRSHTVVRNSGICQGDTLGQYYGLGSETRKTPTQVPDPYGIEVGNPAEIPQGYEEKWLLNIHAIDTRGVVDRLGCTECLCELYNVTKDESLRSDYKGGLHCCVDHTQCRVKEGFQAVRRSLYLRYTVKWVDWDSEILPVKIFIFDVTDTGERQVGSSTAEGQGNGCKVEYDVEPCNAHGWCVDVKRTNVVLPTTGYVVYGVAHQHTGGIGSTLYGKDGQVVCNSVPMYGTGDEPGNEAGYIVGMSTCYPEPGSLKLTAGEELVLESNYSSTNTRGHTGVMGLFYLMVADQAPPPPISLLHHSVSVFDGSSEWTWTILSLLGLAVVAVAVGFSIWLKKRRETEDGYHVIMA
ncbi:unnamed protein product [Linum trigynum]|uniref:Stress up-regulated Nod 19 protein n=1 Tax=Linum trigynum TaxID=586398 RepID=A0AAV2EY12_9ROSI